MPENIGTWQEQLVKCIRCGTCRSVCPVFKIEDNENTTARGKVKLIEAVVEGKLELTPELQKRMSKCLLCKACEAGCPSGVKTEELFLNARRALTEKNGLPLVKRLAFTGLKHHKLFDFGLKTGAMLQSLVFKPAPSGRGRVARIPIPQAGLTARRIIPDLASVPLRSKLPVVNSVSKPKARVAFFTGCMLNYVYPEAGEAIVYILNQNDIEVVLPADQCCCGTPAFTSGDFSVGTFLAEHNVKVLAAGNYDAIITGCATCGSALKHEYRLMLDDSELKAEWEKLVDKVFDISDYLVKIGFKADFGTVNTKVTYHDPCHLNRGMGVTKQPRELIRAIPGVEFVEMKEADKCCGCAGTFSMNYYELSRQINAEKVNNAEATGAELLVTGCSACRMHITDGMGQANSSMKVMHTAELIAEAYRRGKAKGV